MTLGIVIGLISCFLIGLVFGMLGVRSVVRRNVALLEQVEVLESRCQTLEICLMIEDRLR